MAEWYYMSGGQQSGPVSGTQLKSLAASGGLAPEDLVWNESMAEWAAAKRVKGLFANRTGAPAPQTKAMAAAAPVQEEAPPEPAPAENYEAPPEQGSADQPQQESYAEPAPAQSLSYASPSGEAVTVNTVELLRQTRPWVLFISIVMFIGIGLLSLLGLGGILVTVGLGSKVGGGRGAVAGMAGGGLMFGVFFIEAVIMFFPALFLIKYAFAIKRLTVSGGAADLEAALAVQKSFWKFTGIMLIVIIAIYIALLAFILLAALH
jgi:hypothetical protein